MKGLRRVLPAVAMLVLLGGCAASSPEPATSPDPAVSPDPVWVEYVSHRAVDQPEPGQLVGRRTRVYHADTVAVAFLVRAETQTRNRTRARTVVRGRLTRDERERLTTLLGTLRLDDLPNSLPEGDPARLNCKSTAPSITLRVRPTRRASRRTLRAYLGCDARYYPRDFFGTVRALNRWMHGIYDRLQTVETTPRARNEDPDAASPARSFVPDR